MLEASEVLGSFHILRCLLMLGSLEVLEPVDAFGLLEMLGASQLFGPCEVLGASNQEVGATTPPPPCSKQVVSARLWIPFRQLASTRKCSILVEKLSLHGVSGPQPMLLEGLRKENRNPQFPSGLASPRCMGQGSLWRSQKPLGLVQPSDLYMGCWHLRSPPHPVVCSEAHYSIPVVYAHPGRGGG